ncbi:uncharacterized protein LOC122837615 isoform X2 [Gambusia affinis]|uniref:uncharacterized protein LOC122837615 isoform X2 n=1 Tax=Gambusia affinis TaxID=33528 RepID=UPI001CDB9956|nr:uncharacterized protein LOC122837615 isoform X2 [Gambusia affinis]
MISNTTFYTVHCRTMWPGNWCTVTEAVAGLLVMLLFMSYASAEVATCCDGRQNGALCVGPLGGTVCVKLVDSVSESQIYQIKHTSSIILTIKKNDVILGPLQNKYLFIPSKGTFSISNLSLTDSGEYVLDVFDSDGKKKEYQTLNLSLEAPVTSLRLIAECLSEGQVKVSCLSEGGNNPQYSWTLNGNKPSGRELLSGNIESNTIVLRPNVAGRLVCSVRTKVSSLLKEKITSTCDFVNCTSNGIHISKWVFKENNTLCVEPSPETHSIMVLLPIMSGAIGALLIILVVSIGIFCVKRKKPNHKEENNYDQKRSNAGQGRRREELSKETQAEYGKVKKQPRLSVDMTYGNMDNSLYGNVDESIYANL